MLIISDLQRLYLDIDPNNVSNFLPCFPRTGGLLVRPDTVPDMRCRNKFDRSFDSGDYIHLRGGTWVGLKLEQLLLLNEASYRQEPAFHNRFGTSDCMKCRNEHTSIIDALRITGNYFGPVSILIVIWFNHVPCEWWRSNSTSSTLSTLPPSPFYNY